MQKGFVTYFLLEGDPKWLDELNKWHAAYKEWLMKAKSHNLGIDRKVLDQIDTRYRTYHKLREQAINLCKEGKRSEGALIHKDARKQFFLVQSLCAELKESYELKISRKLYTTKSRTGSLHSIVLLTITCAVLISMMLIYILFRNILSPLKQLIIAAGYEGFQSPPHGNEMTLLKSRI